MPSQNQNVSNWNDANVPYGARTVVFKRQASAGSGSWSTTLGTYVLEGITPARSSQVQQRRDEVGQPNGAFGVDNFVEGSAVVQLATAVGSGSGSTTIQIRPGDAFAAIFDASSPALPNMGAGQLESFIVTSADMPEEQLGYKKQSIRFQKLYNVTIAAS